MAEKNIENEIVYLTSKSVTNYSRLPITVRNISGLIQAHKKSSHAPKPASIHHQTRGRGDNRYNHRLNHPNKSGLLKNRVLHGNRVYKPMEATSSDTEKSTSSSSTHQIRTSVIPTASFNTTRIVSSVVSRGNTVKTRRHSNRVYKPNSSDGSSTSSAVATQTSRGVEAIKVNKSSGSKFKWKRRSVSDEKIPSTTSIDGTLVCVCVCEESVWACGVCVCGREKCGREECVILRTYH